MAKGILKKIYDRLRQLIGRQLPPPYESVQEYCELHLHEFLDCSPRDIQTILIVGGFVADEARRMMPTFPNAHFVIFEPSRRVIAITTARFAAYRDRVTVVNAAVSDVSGKVAFHEADAAGNGSILPLAEAAMRDYHLKPDVTYEVDAVRLDDWLAHWERPASSRGGIDLVWCDVQGAELHVLRGAGDWLARTRALFLEVSLWEPMYEGAALMGEVSEFVRPYGFLPTLLGTAPINGTGNALFVNPAMRGGQ